jgi:hypothetical protein
MGKKVTTRKVRWLRTYDASGAAIVEIPSQPNEKPLSGRPSPQQGCNSEITRIQVAEDSRQWWTLGLKLLAIGLCAPQSAKDGAVYPRSIFPATKLRRIFELSFLAGPDKTVNREAPLRLALSAKA